MLLMEALKFVLGGIAISIGAYLLVALVLALANSPVVPESTGRAIAFTSLTEADYADLPPTRSFAARDGAGLSYRLYGDLTAARRLLVLVHGSAWHGMQFHAMARELSGDRETAVVVPDLRGHGANPVTRGDVAHIGQLEEDLADLIGAVTAAHADLTVVLAGHSSGGGLVVRFAGGDYGRLADGFVLIAPFLKHNAPTTRANSGGWAFPATPRIVGLSMLNMVGITALHGLPVIAFAMPRSVLEGPYGETVTTSYSYRLNTSIAPRPDYEADLAAIDRPLLLLVGAEDEAFEAERYEPVISAQTTTGTYEILPEAGHIGILTDTRSVRVIRDWLASSGL
ncbi:alpha/beta hydrolase [Devosia sp.]|uniref:alpha/beta hydrolase n=1 Tax=Devosia sp. TaxID=1871048 RepID=UPI003A94D713